MTLKQLATAHGVSLATINRYKRDGAPLKDARAMQTWKDEKRSRRFVSKFMAKSSVRAPASPVTVVAGVELEPGYVIKTQEELAAKVVRLTEYLLKIHFIALNARNHARCKEVLAITSPWIDEDEED